MSAILAGQTLATGFKTGQKLSSDVFSFDFIALITKLVVFFGVAYVVTKTFEAIIFGEGVVKGLLGFFGVNLPSTMPENVISFFTDGFKGIKFWDIVKTIAIILVLLEWFNWMNTQKALKIEPSPVTQGVFLMIITGLTLITVPELFTRLKELRAMNQVAT